MIQRDSLKNPVPLYNLLRNEIREILDGQIFLSEDLYYKDVLIIKSGSFLDDETIYRLINFGFKRVNIILDDLADRRKSIENLSIISLKKRFLKEQKCLIADKNAYQINELASILTSAYFKEENILAVNNSFPVKNVITDKNPQFIFIDLNLYPNNGLKVLKEIKEMTSASIFLTAMVDQSKQELVKKLKNEVEANNAKLLLKPVSAVYLRTLLFNSVSNSDIKRFLANKKHLVNKFKFA